VIEVPLWWITFPFFVGWSLIWIVGVANEVMDEADKEVEA
jgi:hypothetical protein